MQAINCRIYEEVSSERMSLFCKNITYPPPTSSLSPLFFFTADITTEIDIDKDIDIHIHIQSERKREREKERVRNRLFQVEQTATLRGDKCTRQYIHPSIYLSIYLSFICATSVSSYQHFEAYKKRPCLFVYCCISSIQKSAWYMLSTQYVFVKYITWGVCVWCINELE